MKALELMIETYKNGGKILVCWNGGKLKDIADVIIKVPEKDTYKVQELHLPVYHYLCAMAEKVFLGTDSKF